MGDYAGPASEPAEAPATSKTDTAAPAISSPQEAVDAAPSYAAQDASPPAETTVAETPAVTAMGDYAGPASEPAETTTEIGPSSPSSQEDTYDAPAVTPMGDVGMPASSAPAELTIGPSSPSSQEDSYEAPAVTPMGDVGMPSAPAEDNPVTPNRTGTSIGSSSPSSQEESYEGPTYTPMGDLAIPGTESYTAPEPTTPTTTNTQSEPDGVVAQATGALGPLGGSFAFARDSQNTSISFGPAEGYGFFGSIAQGRAARESSVQATLRGAIGPLSGEFSAGSSAITGKANWGIPLNPGLNQVHSGSFELNRQGEFTTATTEGASFGAQQGFVSTQTVTISVPNSTLDWIGNTVGGWFGAGPNAPTGGGW
jgi:hypothetical protein